MTETVPDTPAEQPEEAPMSGAEEAALQQEQENLNQAIVQSQMAYLTNRLTVLARENALLKEQLAAAQDVQDS